MQKPIVLVVAILISGLLLVGAVYAANTQGLAQMLGSGTQMLGAAQEALFSVLRVPSSCKLGGATVASGSSKAFYLVPSVPTGQTCESVQEYRKCLDGNLSGSPSYSYSTCTVSASLSNIRPNLQKFLPYVWATTWYPWFNDQIGTDSEGRGLALFKKQIDSIKAQGFNTVWIGGVATWQQLQPTPGIWDLDALANLKEHLKVLQDKNMRAIFQLNYIGLGYAPQGIDGCTWMNDPAQVQKFTDFVTGLGGQLASYNYMIYYMVFTEQANNCLLARDQANIYKGITLLPGGKSKTVDIETQADSQYEDVHEVNTMLKNSIGRFTKAMPPAVRSQMYIGIHDAFVSDGQITDDVPVELPSDFDYVSMAYYPSYQEVAAFPSDTAIGSGGTNTTVGSAAYTKVINNLDTAKSRLMAYFPSTPLLMGEFGWPAWDTTAGAPAFKLDSPARNLATLAMLDWSITRKVGFNLWGWLPRYIDTPEKETPYGAGLSLVARDANIETATPTLSTVSAVLRQKLKGEAPPAAGCQWDGATIASGTSVTAYQAASVPDGQSCVSQKRTCTNGVLSGTYTHAACKVMPLTTLSAQCSADGTQATFSWTPVSGATAYYLNVYDATLAKYLRGPNALATSPVTVSVASGNTNTSWVYVVTSAGWSKAIGATPITCRASAPTTPAPTPTTDDPPEETEVTPQ